MESIIALDIETTGLDPEKDTIIEIGAVRFNGNRVENEWSTLINPGRRIPPLITQLTGINDQMVLKAPAIQAVITDLAHFVGDSPILGHNIRFDLSFLRKKGLFHRNAVMDTYELAAILLPNAGRYKLGALAQALNVPLPATHRALKDAHATRGVFLRLYEEALQMPLNLLAEIVRMSEGIEWDGYLPFRWVLRARSREIVSRASVERIDPNAFSAWAQPVTAPPLNPSGDPAPLNEDEVAAILEYGGAFSHHFPQYEYRIQQVEMLRAVTQALSDGNHLLVEAGTGVGKSIAYLIPAALFAMQNDRRVVISTNTINLQDQLINKDIPDLRAALGIDLRATILKGRGNYLCPRRVESMRRRGPESVDELRVLAKILVWLQSTRTGDRGEINLNGPAENQVWSRLSAEDETCTAENCLKHFGGACPFYRVRQAAFSSHLIIVNHALLLADVATGNRVLPEYDYLIIDEAHHLESATTNALSYRITQNDFDRLLRELGGSNSGLLGWLLNATQEILSPSEYAAVNQIVNHTTDLAFRLESQGRNFFSTIDHFLNDLREGRQVGNYSHQERIVPATRTQPAWGDVELAWDECQHTLEHLLDCLGKINQSLAEIQEALGEADEELFSHFLNLHRRFLEYHDNMNALVFEPIENRIYWAEIQPMNNRISLNAAPLHIGPLMDHYLWREKAAVILTSATLTTAGEFDYLKNRLSAEEAAELALGSPFDYERSALLYIAKDMPDPTDRNNHQHAVEQGLIHLCRATGGRTLVLFTSYEQLRKTSHAIGPVLARNGILVFEQGEGASAHALLDSFRTTERAVLLGTRAFWEGVDVPGEALSVLVIVKLPFDVPSDPIIAARSETFEDPFNQYSLPEAILRFRQGFGRLIRSQQDHGVVVILDPRVMTKRYGRLFLDSIPTCTVRVGMLNELPAAAVRWLNL